MLSVRESVMSSSMNATLFQPCKRASTRPRFRFRLRSLARPALASRNAKSDVRVGKPRCFQVSEIGMTRERPPGVLATRFATWSALVCLLHSTTSRTPRCEVSSIAGWRKDAGLDAGTITASRRPRLDLRGGAGDPETSRDRCACDSRCRTLLSNRLGPMTVPFTDEDPGSAPTQTDESRGFEGRVTRSRW
jgi:hypothetical protein